MKKYDVIIVGGGPAGAATALNLLRLGITPLIIEKDTFPRYHIGESLTGEAAACIRKLGLDTAIEKESYPIKHGVRVFGTNGNNAFWVPVTRRVDEKTLVPNSTWQVKRSRFDQILLDTALERGAEIMHCEAVTPIMNGDTVVGLQVRQPDDSLEDLKCEVLVDASGQSTFLANRGLTSEKIRGKYDRQLGVFSQFAGAIRGQDGNENVQERDNTIIFYRQQYHWAWFIPITPELTSVGVVMPVGYFKGQNLSKEQLLKEELGTLNPELSKRLPNLEYQEDVRTIATYSYEVRNFTGKGRLCVGDSHRFIDPIFSFGVTFAMREGEFAAQAIADHLGGKTSGDENPFQAYETLTNQGQDVIQDLIDCFWEYPLPFLRMVHVRYPDTMTDLFAGRIHGESAERNDCRMAMRGFLSRTLEAAVA